MIAIKKFMRPNVYTKVPDGGWGWVIAVAFFFVEAFTYGIVNTFGVFFDELKDYFHESNDKVSWIFSICAFVFTVTAPITTILTNKFGHRFVVMAGGFLSSVGMIAAAFATNIYIMYITIGVMSGLGYSLSFFPSLTILLKYFDRRRSLVISIATTGECFAVILFVPEFTALMHYKGWRVCLFVIGALQLIIVVCGFLLQPIIIEPEENNKQPSEVEKHSACRLDNKDKLTSIDPTDSGINISKSKSCTNAATNTKADVVIDMSMEEKMIEPVELEKKDKLLLDFSVLKNTSFIFYTLFGLFSVFGTCIPPLFIISFSVSLGIAEELSTHILILMAIAELLGKISAGFIMHKEPINKIYIELIFVILLCLALVAIPSAHTFLGLMACSFFYSYMMGAVTATYIPLIGEKDIVGIEKMESAVGVFVFIHSFISLSGPPLTGILVDKTKYYGSAFYVSAIGMAIGAVFLGIVKPCQNGLWKNKAPATQDSTECQDAQDVPEVDDNMSVTEPYSSTIGMTLRAICLAIVRPCMNRECKKKSLAPKDYNECQDAQDVPIDITEVDENLSGTEPYSSTIGVTLCAICVAIVRPCMNGWCKKKSPATQDYSVSQDAQDVPIEIPEMDGNLSAD
ncbi:monocarboxylate transporter 7 [Pelobates cultripes]|uniref:Monocarboxylate transporter 7 n=2 Tax=Pelobates cultripes TaxID=61616 RepID=A0AAD1R2C8_PELCU|nr:monocarboxylate transporter 7 [Pelobates cultripes]